MLKMEVPVLTGSSDTLRRHIRQNHEGSGNMPPIKQACENCRALKSRCQGGMPCTGCERRNIYCSLLDQPRSSEQELKSRDQSPQHAASLSYPEKIQHFLNLYFELFHPHWQIIHKGSFDPRTEADLLVKSMVVIGMWTTGVQSTQSAAIDLHAVLNSAIYQQRVCFSAFKFMANVLNRKLQDKWDASIAENASSICTWSIPTYQAILLHIIFALISKRNLSLGLDLKPPSPVIDTGLLASLVLSCKKLGMFYYPNILAQFNPSNPASYVWLAVEEVKRFNVALYRVCRVLDSNQRYGNIKDRGSPEVTSWRLNASELNFPIPRNDSLWNAENDEERTYAGIDYVDCIDWNNTMETQWISRSADLVAYLS